MSPGEQFELGVDTAFQTVCGGFDPVRFKDCFWGLEVDKQQVASPEVVETVVGLAHAGMSPATDDFEALQSATLTRAA